MSALGLALGLLLGASPSLERLGPGGEASPLISAFLREGEHMRVSLSEPAAAPVRWFEVRALARDYDNVAFCQGPPRGGCHQPLAYELRELLALRGHPSFEVAEVPELRALGTHRIAFRLNGQNLEPASLDESMVAALPSIVVRRDDSYVGRASELIGLPFVFWPALLPGIGHQTDQRLGADCAAVVLYARRTSGASRSPRAAAPSLPSCAPAVAAT